MKNDQPLTTTMHSLELSGGRVEQVGPVTRFAIPPTTARAYADAQWDDYHGLRRGQFPHRPPARLRLRARFSHEAEALGGTAGFGFWNDPFTPSGGGVVAAPNAVWFFAASPPNDMALFDGIPGRGWKAAALHTGRWPMAILLPAAGVGILLTRVPGLRRIVMRSARKFIKASEQLLPLAMTEWHEYALEWGAAEAVFWVDGGVALRAPAPPAGPLGFVAWVDNQYAVASEAGRFGFGLVAHAEPRWMEVSDLSVG